MDDLAKISDLLNELQATADRRLELLKEIAKDMKVCPICYTKYHTDDCRLAKELSGNE